MSDQCRRSGQKKVDNGRSGPSESFEVDPDRAFWSGSTFTFRGVGSLNRTAKTIMFLGTGSDVGKSIVATAFCRIFRRRGFSVSPFKAQNMSNNSFITVEGGEIGRAQVVQAEAAGVPPSNDMNPILLKPSSPIGAQLVVQGRVHGQTDAAGYPNYKATLTDAVMDSFNRLAGRHDIVVLEGAGSCCEINLRRNDLVNFPMAERAQAPCVLVADIDRGGVFAQVIGSVNLMTRTERALTAGFLINKFRGDPDLFADGIEIIERRTRKPVFGLVPFLEGLRIDPEDSVAVQPDQRPVVPPRSDRINAAVVHLPGLSNFTDMSALDRERDVLVNYLSGPTDLSAYDLLILPGTKNVMEDAVWLRRRGWTEAIVAYHQAGGSILGLCGGYQLLGMEILDPHGVESPRPRVPGLGLLPLSTTLATDKILRRVVGADLRCRAKVEGYEIHMGRTRVLSRRKGSASIRPMLRLREPGQAESWEDGFTNEDGRIQGTYVHGLLDAPGWRTRFLNEMRRRKGLPERHRAAAGGGRFREYDRLADHFERHVDVDRICHIMGL